jgi:hypothetical protein
MQNKPIAVFGATGHTGRFVLGELERRGLRATLVGRDAKKLAAAGAARPGSATRLARIDDPTSLDDAFRGAAAVINCAGPFLDTALPVFEAALRAGIPYLDVTAEQGAVQLLLERHDDARQRGVTALPAAAFYGGLADLLVTSLLGTSGAVDDVEVAVALDSWHPTAGTRLTGARNTARRVMVRDGNLQPIDGPQPNKTWTFPTPFGEQEVAMLPFSETIMLSQHLSATNIESWINVNALRDVRETTTPPPVASDDRGRSSQSFLMDAHVRIGEQWRRAYACGRDIYAASAPIVVEALERTLAGNVDTAGVRTLGEIFDASDFLQALDRRGDIRVEYAPVRGHSYHR